MVGFFISSFLSTSFLNMCDNIQFADENVLELCWFFNAKTWRKLYWLRTKIKIDVFI